MRGQMTADWIATGLSQDLPPGVALAGAWNGVDLAIWRSVAGRISAWKDRCPHRGMRLSHGFVRGETLACIYHGWVYGTSGVCRHIPAHPALTPPDAIRPEAFACTEADGVIWVAPVGITTPPPAFPGLYPLRSLSMTVGADDLRKAEPALSGAVALQGRCFVQGQAVTLCLLPQPRAGGVRVHVLCDAGTDRVQVSRWLEDLRRRAEAGVAA